MISFLFTVVDTREARLHSENIGRGLELFVQCDSRGVLLRLLNAETAVLKREVRIKLGQHKWQHTARLGVVPLVAPIHEHILFPGVTVQIAEKQ